MDHRIGPAPGARIVETDALHRAETQSFGAAFGHHFDRHAALKVRRVRFPILELGLLAVDQPLNDGVILILVPRAVDIVIAVADRPDLVTRSETRCVWKALDST